MLRIRFPSNRNAGRSVGRPPVATIAAPNRTSSSPSEVFTWTESGPVNAASPSKTSTPFPRHSVATPEVSRSTIASFHSWSFAMSTEMSGIETPNSSALRALWTKFPAPMRAFEGMQP